MWRRIIFGTVITTLLVGGAFWFFHTKRARTPIADGINAIPSDAAVIFESRNVRNAWRKLSQTNIMWEELLGTETVQELNAQAVSIDSVLQLNPAVYSTLDSRPVYVSLHTITKASADPGPESSVHALYVISLPDLNYQGTVEEFFETAVNHGKPIYTAEYIGDARIGVIQLKKNKLLYFAVSSGILVMSSKDELLRNAVTQLQSGTSIAKDNSFSKVMAASGKNVDANVYVNYRQFPALLNGMLNEEVKRELLPFSDFAAYSGWDVTIKPNALSMNGFTAPGTKSFLTLFTYQKPQEIELPSVIPAKTASMLFFGLSNVAGFHHDYFVHRAETKKDNVIDTTVNKFLITDAFLEKLEGELALVITESPPGEATEHSYAVMRSGDIGEAVSILNGITAVYRNNPETAEKDKKKKGNGDTTSYRGHQLNRFGIPGVLPYLFGDVFSDIPSNYFAVINDYIIFGNSPAALKSFIDDYESHHTLVNDKNYKAFAENMSASANIFLYSCIARSPEIYTSFLSDDLAYDLRMKTDLLKKFEATGFQFSSGNKLFYSNIYLKYNPEQKQETGTLWETQLDTTISSKPYLLINHNTKAREVLVQDDANKLYLISNTGKIIWTKKLSEKIMSDVIQVDVLKNDKFQMVFNTRSFIYMYDRNGNEMKGFPLKLRSPATNAISVIDYENNRDYRIFIATENKRIVCYKANGEQVTAFAFDKTDDQVFLPVQYFSTANKDHLCAIDAKGKVYILDRHGEVRVKLEERMAQGIRGFFAEPGRDYSKSWLVAADTLGNIIRLNLAGKKEIISLQAFDSSPFFDMRDVNNDKTKEFIFLTRNQLNVFTQDHTLLFSYEFKEKLSQPPLFFQFPDNTGKIGVVSELTNELFLFNENGSLFNGFPVSGKTLFSIGDLNNEGHYNLVTGSSENSIFVYQLR